MLKSSFIINQDEKPHLCYTYIHNTLVSNRIIIRPKSTWGGYASYEAERVLRAAYDSVHTREKKDCRYSRPNNHSIRGWAPCRQPEVKFTYFFSLFVVLLRPIYNFFISARVSLNNLVVFVYSC